MDQKKRMMALNKRVISRLDSLEMKNLEGGNTWKYRSGLSACHGDCYTEATYDPTRCECDSVTTAPK